MEQSEIVAGLREERLALTEYLRTLSAASWDVPSLCAGWSVRNVVSHLVGNCADVLDQNLEGIGSPESNQRQVDERAGRSGEELLGEWDEKGPGCEAVYEAMPPELWTLDMPGIIGTIGTGVLRQLEDLWFHAQDIRIPLGVDPSAGIGLRAALELIAMEVPDLLRKHAPEVGALELNLADFRFTVLGPGTSTVQISGDPVTFALLAAGRTPLGAAQAEGRLLVDPLLPNAERVLQIYGPEFLDRVRLG
jgi:uncharacterized protein (TIGR03083 family)